MSIIFRNYAFIWPRLRNIRSSLIFSAKTLSRSLSSQNEPSRRVTNDPIKFAGSPAASWTAKQGRSGTIDYEEIPWFQTYAVVGSTTIFMIYFFYLREENDIDQEMEKSLYERIPGLEKTQLILNYKYNIENSIDNSKIVARMKELDMKPEEIEL